MVRDNNINKEQQRRVRKEVTLPTALQYYYNLDATLEFLSHESLYLYGGAYLKWLSKVLDFPIAYSDDRVIKDISEDQNAKYVKHVEEHWLDEQVWQGIRPKMNGKYLLMTGAPGSRWSGVANNLHSSPDFDQTDDTEERSFSHHNGLVHGGAYFDPKMEFGFSKYNWPLPFFGEGVRLIKSHTLSTHMNYFKDYPIVMVLRNDYECWTWWNECGGFDIPYPSYEWYKNQDNMFAQITLQNMSINSSYITIGIK